MVTFKCNKQYKSNAKTTNTTGVIYKNEIDSMNKEIEKLAKEIWDIHSLLLKRVT